MAIRILYQTLDEVNFQLALRFARECGAAVVSTLRRSGGEASPHVKRLHDLDHVLPQQRDAILEELLARPVNTPVAVHGYNLGERQVAGLRSRRVFVSHSLVPSLIRCLCQAPQEDDELIPLDGDHDGLQVPDPAELCRMVRSTAIRAHRALSRPDGITPEEINDLKQRLTLLKRAVDAIRHTRSLPLEELSRWLGTLGRQLREVHF